MVSRYVASATCGIAVTLALLYVMNLLIQLQALDPGPDRKPFWIGRANVVVPDDPVIEEIPDFPALREPVARTPRQAPVGVEKEPVAGPMPTGPVIPRAPDGGSFAAPANGDGPLVSVMMVQPTYPGPAITRSLEGYVVVEFDVLADGTVANAVAIESSHAVFERPAIDAAMRCRFKARVVDGEARVSTGIRKRFVFELDHG